MKKLLICISMLLPMLLIGCGGNDTAERTPLEQYTEALLTQFPNYKSNEMALNAMNDSIKAHARAQIGTIPSDLSGMKFHFENLKEGNDTCVAVFSATGYAEIDAPKNSQNKYITATPGIMVVGKVDKATAASLDYNKEYSVTGEMFEWDAKPLNYSSVVDIPFGTYYLDALTISEIPAQK